MKIADRYRGCLLGGAAGDALGYTVEFFTDAHIFARYGENGITEYTLTDGVAQVSDDTQMTLFTANGLLLAESDEKQYIHYIARCYEDWLLTQDAELFSGREVQCSWLNNVADMNHSRAPGRTCIYAIMNGTDGTIENPINDSKGCGGVMRVAPIGLFFEGYGTKEIDMIGAQAAALTHGHDLGYIPAAMLVHIIQLVSHNPDILLCDAVADARDAMPELFPDAEHITEFIQLIDKAIALSKETDVDDLELIRELGEGWVAEETLAIAVYCALRYSNNFEKAIIAAVNHSGDSDSTGAVTGNILGAYLGMSAIPQKFLDNLELRDVIEEIADDLLADCNSMNCPDAWKKKYIKK